jgi:hypothetical protein
MVDRENAISRALEKSGPQLLAQAKYLSCTNFCLLKTDDKYCRYTSYDLRSQACICCLRATNLQHARTSILISCRQALFRISSFISSFLLFLFFSNFLPLFSSFLPSFPFLFSLSPSSLCSLFFHLCHLVLTSLCVYSITSSPSLWRRRVTGHPRPSRNRAISTDLLSIDASMSLEAMVPFQVTHMFCHWHGEISALVHASSHLSLVFYSFTR